MGVKDKIWVVCRISKDHISHIDKDLEKFDYEDVQAYIPTIKLLKKKFKGKEEFQSIPLLFNYGFIQLPKLRLLQPEFMGTLRTDIPGIHSFLRNIASRDKGYAIVNNKYITYIKKVQDELSIYSSTEVSKIKKDSYIKLQCYPYEDTPAQVLEVNEASKYVEVRLLDAGEGPFAKIKVSFENVFYTIYSDYELNGREKSLESLGYNNKRGIDKLFATINR